MSREADRDDAALREAFAELGRGEAAEAPAFAQLMARPRSATTLGAPSSRRRVRESEPRAQRRFSASTRAVRGLVPRLAATAAVVVAAATGVWLARTQTERGGVFANRDVESFATWVAPTDFLLHTPAAELLRTIPEIPGSLPLELAVTAPDRPTGEIR